MPSEQETWGVGQLLEADLGRAVLLCTPSVLDRVAGWPFERVESISALPSGLDTLVVVGGGGLIDRAKAWRVDDSPSTRLVAVPSIWGSGAEASPVVVLDGESDKHIRMGPEFLPEVRCYWPALADSLPGDLARFACGDAWSHALEGFLSPLADDAVRADLAGVIRTLSELPIGADARWFKPSGDACAGQARAGVGLVHGIAHTLEPGLRREDAGWGHARLCASFAWPVMAFNRRQGDKWYRLFAEYDLDAAAVFERLRELHSPSDFDVALPFLAARWMDVLRDPCTRTNSSLVRRDALHFFTEREFQ